MLALGEKYGPTRLEAACAKALAAGDPAYRTIKNILTADWSQPHPVLDVRGRLLQPDAVHACYDAVRRLADPDAPSINNAPDEDEDAVAPSHGSGPATLRIAMGTEDACNLYERMEDGDRAPLVLTDGRLVHIVSPNC